MALLGVLLLVLGASLDGYQFVDGGNARRSHPAMESTARQWQVREGMTVYGADREKVGKIVAVDPAYVVVKRGLLFATNHYVPASAITSVSGDKVFIAVTKDQALNQGWDQPGAVAEKRTIDAAVAEQQAGGQTGGQATSAQATSGQVDEAYQEPPSEPGPDVPPGPRPRPEDI